MWAATGRVVVCVVSLAGCAAGSDKGVGFSPSTDARVEDSRALVDSAGAAPADADADVVDANSPADSTADPADVVYAEEADTSGGAAFVSAFPVKDADRCDPITPCSWSPDGAPLQAGSTVVGERLPPFAVRAVRCELEFATTVSGCAPRLSVMIGSAAGVTVQCEGPIASGTSTFIQTTYVPPSLPALSSPLQITLRRSGGLTPCEKTGTIIVKSTSRLVFMP